MQPQCDSREPPGDEGDVVEALLTTKIRLSLSAFEAKPHTPWLLSASYTRIVLYSCTVFPVVNWFQKAREQGSPTVHASAK